jgi:hypothetical protein
MSSKYFLNKLKFYFFSNYEIPEEKGFVNRRLEPKSNYMKAIEKQIEEKKTNYESEKYHENKVVTEVNQIVQKQMEDEENFRKMKMLKIKSEFAAGNKILIMKKTAQKEVKQYFY